MILHSHDQNHPVHTACRKELYHEHFLSSPTTHTQQPYSQPCTCSEDKNYLHWVQRKEQRQSYIHLDWMEVEQGPLTPEAAAILSLEAVPFINLTRIKLFTFPECTPLGSCKRGWFTMTQSKISHILYLPCSDFTSSESKHNMRSVCAFRQQLLHINSMSLVGF